VVKTLLLLATICEQKGGKPERDLKDLSQLTLTGQALPADARVQESRKVETCGRKKISISDENFFRQIFILQFSTNFHPKTT
jgi:hypothetical protein